MFSWDINVATAISAAAVIVVQLISLTVFLVRTNGKANGAHELAERAYRRADEAHVGIGATNASIAILREEVARNNPDHDVLEAMEGRLMTEIHRLGDRLDEVLNRRSR